MSRWVDADWIKDRNSFVPKNELHTVEEFLQILDKAPTADVVPITREVNVVHGEIDVKNGTVTYHSDTSDVVEVVRCADCKYLNEDLAVGEWDGSCRYWNTHSVLYSWFCSQGERKDGDGDG